MKFYSTNNRAHRVNLEEAVVRGLAPDNGLYMPERITPLPPDFFQELGTRSFTDLSYLVADHLLHGDLPEDVLRGIVESTIQFDAPTVEVEPGVFALELFHGPTMAFKDFGARFLSGLLGYFAQKQDRDVVILAATSGDTGSAVANGFLNVKGTRVVVLYPSGKVSEIQEKQFTTLGNNVTALEVDGTFDDCQKLVKEAFRDDELRKLLFLTSANSINIGRLIPQTFYYFRAYAQVMSFNKPVQFSVPSGNFGNLAAGLISKRLGLPVQQFIAATNANDVVPAYLASGVLAPKPSVATISNAMDVGNPSNVSRILDLYNNDWQAIKEDIAGCWFSDRETAVALKEVYTRTGYLMDPHGAIGYLGLKREWTGSDSIGIFLETAHPGKFKEVVETAIVSELEVPERLRLFLLKEKKSTRLGKDFHSFKEFLKSI